MAAGLFQILGQDLAEHPFAATTKANQRKPTNKSALWINVDFEHPTTFETLALKAETKKDIMDDLIVFIESEDYGKSTFDGCNSQFVAL